MTYKKTLYVEITRGKVVMGLEGVLRAPSRGIGGRAPQRSTVFVRYFIKGILEISFIISVALVFLYKRTLLGDFIIRKIREKTQ